MDAAFIKLLNMSITAGWLVLAVIILRLLLKKAPKWITGILWGFVALRLVCPFSAESILSLIPSAEPIPKNILTTELPIINSGFPALNQTVNPVISEKLSPVPGASINPMQIVAFIASVIWIIGIAAMIIYTAVSYLKIHNKVKEAVPYKDNIWLCDRIDTPFILGVIKPRIFLPSSMNENDMEYVIAHERSHLKRRDHIVKPLGFLLLSVYWFNPLIWVAYALLCKDIELACDERVIKELGAEIKKPYSEALINCSVPRRAVSACPLAFGETGVKARVKSVLSYQKPAFWIIICAVIACSVTAACLLTNPPNSKFDNIIRESGYKMTGQADYDFTGSIPKDKLPDSIYTVDGHNFGKNEIVVYETDTTSVYLKRTQLINENYDDVYLIFDYSYKYLPDSGQILLPYTINNGGYKIAGYSLCINLRNNTLTDDTNEYRDGVKLSYQGPDTEFGLSVSRSLLKSAVGTIKFEARCTEFSYAAQKGTAPPDLRETQYRAVQTAYSDMTLSAAFTADSLPQYFISDQMVLMDNQGEPTDSKWNEIGKLSEYSLIKSDFKKLFADSKGWADKHSFADICRHNEYAWRAEDDTAAYYLLVQKNGLVYIAYAFKADDGEKITWVAVMYPDNFTSSPGLPSAETNYRSYASYAGYTDSPEIYQGALNKETFAVSHIRHLPVFRVDSTGELKKFKSDYKNCFDFKNGYDEVPSFNEAVRDCDDSFFEENILFLVYVASGSGSNRYSLNSISNDGYGFVMHIENTNTDDAGTADMAGWFVIVSTDRASVSSCVRFDADLVDTPN